MMNLAENRISEAEALWDILSGDPREIEVNGAVFNYGKMKVPRLIPKPKTTKTQNNDDKARMIVSPILSISIPPTKSNFEMTQELFYESKSLRSRLRLAENDPCIYHALSYNHYMEDNKHGQVPPATITTHELDSKDVCVEDESIHSSDSEFDAIYNDIMQMAMSEEIQTERTEMTTEKRDRLNGRSKRAGVEVPAKSNNRRPINRLIICRSKDLSSWICAPKIPSPNNSKKGTKSNDISEAGASNAPDVPLLTKRQRKRHRKAAKKLEKLQEKEKHTEAQEITEKGKREILETQVPPEKPVAATDTSGKPVGSEITENKISGAEALAVKQKNISDTGASSTFWLPRLTKNQRKKQRKEANRQRKLLENETQVEAQGREEKEGDNTIPGAQAAPEKHTTYITDNDDDYTLFLDESEPEKNFSLYRDESESESENHIIQLDDMTKVSHEKLSHTSESNDSLQSTDLELSLLSKSQRKRQQKAAKKLEKRLRNEKSMQAQEEETIIGEEIEEEQNSENTILPEGEYIDNNPSVAEIVEKKTNVCPPSKRDCASTSHTSLVDDSVIESENATSGVVMTINKVKEREDSVVDTKKANNTDTNVSALPKKTMPNKNLSEEKENTYMNSCENSTDKGLCNKKTKETARRVKDTSSKQQLHMKTNFTAEDCAQQPFDKKTSQFEGASAEIPNKTSLNYGDLASNKQQTSDKTVGKTKSKVKKQSSSKLKREQKKRNKKQQHTNQVVVSSKNNKQKMEKEVKETTNTSKEISEHRYSDNRQCKRNRKNSDNLKASASKTLAVGSVDKQLSTQKMHFEKDVHTTHHRDTSGRGISKQNQNLLTTKNLNVDTSDALVVESRSIQLSTQESGLENALCENTQELVENAENAEMSCISVQDHREDKERDNDVCDAITAASRLAQLSIQENDLENNNHVSDSTGEKEERVRTLPDTKTQGLAENMDRCFAMQNRRPHIKRDFEQPTSSTTFKNRGETGCDKSGHTSENMRYDCPKTTASSDEDNASYKGCSYTFIRERTHRDSLTSEALKVCKTQFNLSKTVDKIQQAQQETGNIAFVPNSHKPPTNEYLSEMSDSSVWPITAKNDLNCDNAKEKNLAKPVTVNVTKGRRITIADRIRHNAPPELECTSYNKEEDSLNNSLPALKIHRIPSVTNASSFETHEDESISQCMANDMPDTIANTQSERTAVRKEYREDKSIPYCKTVSMSNPFDTGPNGEQVVQQTYYKDKGISDRVANIHATNINDETIARAMENVNLNTSETKPLIDKSTKKLLFEGPTCYGKQNELKETVAENIQTISGDIQLKENTQAKGGDMQHTNAIQHYVTPEDNLASKVPKDSKDFNITANNNTQSIIKTSEVPTLQENKSNCSYVHSHISENKTCHAGDALVVVKQLYDYGCVIPNRAHDDQHYRMGRLARTGILTDDDNLDIVNQLHDQGLFNTEMNYYNDLSHEQPVLLLTSEEKSEETEISEARCEKTETSDARCEKKAEKDIQLQDTRNPMHMTDFSWDTNVIKNIHKQHTGLCFNLLDIWRTDIDVLGDPVAVMSDPMVLYYKQTNFFRPYFRDSDTKRCGRKIVGRDSSPIDDEYVSVISKIGWYSSTVIALREKYKRGQGSYENYMRSRCLVKELSALLVRKQQLECKSVSPGAENVLSD